MTDVAVIIRDLATPDDYAACLALQDETWGSAFSERIPPAMLKVSQRIGGVSAGAFDDSGRLVGFVFGLTGVKDGELVHWSDMLAVREPYRGTGLGRRLKEYQREKVLALGVHRMFWTYDPLIAANAHFNINRLGARPVEYVVDMYGSNTGSALHGALPTDRFIAEWDLDEFQPGESAGILQIDILQPPGEPPPDLAELFPLANPNGPDGAPLCQPFGEALFVRVQIPRALTLEGVRGAEAMRWRLAVRDSCVALLQDRYRVIGFIPAANDPDVLPYYVFASPLASTT